MKYTLDPSEGRTHLSTSLALEQFLATWSDTHLLNDLGPHLTCTEVEALCDLLSAHDRHDAADALRKGHIEEDDSGDLNHNTLDEWTDEALAAIGED